MNIDISKYTIPTLGTLCAIGALMVASGMRTPVEIDTGSDTGNSELRMPENLVLGGFVPTMEEVVAKHLIVPERVATGENAFPDLMVKGVYIGTERSAVFSLRSRPEANLRIWQGDEDAALAQFDRDRDPRQPIVDFLGEWEIKSIDFSGVVLEHLITGEVETYAVEYNPVKHAKDSAQAGYGQGRVADAAPGSKAPAARRAPAAPSRQPRGSVPSSQAVAGRVGAFMQRMTPQQRQQFLQQLQKQNDAANKKSRDSSKNRKKSSKQNR